MSINSSTSKNISYIKILQNILISQGYELQSNGVFDENTKQAVIDYQSSAGLKKDGIVGANTWKSLLKLNNVDIQPKVIGSKTNLPPVTSKTSVIAPNKIDNKKNKRANKLLFFFLLI